MAAFEDMVQLIESYEPEEPDWCWTGEMYTKKKRGELTLAFHRGTRPARQHPQTKHITSNYINESQLATSNNTTTKLITKQH